MDITLDVSPTTKIDCITLHKMAFIYNAVQSGWEVKMDKNNYVFSKKHEGKKEIYLDKYLRSFIESNLDLNLIK